MRIGLLSLALALALAAGLTLTVCLWHRAAPSPPPPARLSPPEKAQSRPTAPPGTVERPSVLEQQTAAPPRSQEKPGPRPLLSPAPARTKSTSGLASNPPPRSTPKEPIADPLARVALSFVGADPEAEAYWYEAINDRRLSAHERQDLIEDLNEDGFANPKNPTADDLPLVLSRLALIQEVGADAMDQVNAEAFAEAYKDLINIANRLLATANTGR